MSNLHRTRRRELRGLDLPLSGGDGDESIWVRCKQCGYIIDSSVTPPGSGYGKKIVTDSYAIVIQGWGTQPWGTSPWGGSGSTVWYGKQVDSGSGCPMCGTGEYQ